MSRDNRSIVRAFAQGEMVMQFMEGIDERYGRYLELSIRDLLAQVTESLVRRYSTGTASAINRRVGQIKGITKNMLDQLLKNAETTRRLKFINPVLGAVEVLPKEDLGNFAEALVNLTSIKRRVSLDMETVGGAIDVAIISKGDGFIWLRRKHYFDLDLNPHFVPNYLIKT